jgi:hypothetical protein
MRPHSTLSPATQKRTALRLETLADRVVPAVIDLTTVGAVGSVGGVFFMQYDASGTTTADVDPFLAVQAGENSKSEKGYNTDGSTQFNTISARALPVTELPVVDNGGVPYREILLDVNETQASPLISLDELNLYVSNSSTLTGFKKEKLGGVAPVYRLDAGGDSRVVLDDRLNASGYGDMRVMVPDSVLSGGAYVYLYCNFGKANAVNDGAEEWAVHLPPPPPPPPPPPSGSITGLVFSDSVIQNDQKDDGEDVLPDRLVFLDTDFDGLFDPGEVNVTSDANGQYTFTGLSAGTYMVWVEVFGTESTHGYQIDLAENATEPRDIAIVPFGGGT